MMKRIFSVLVGASLLTGNALAGQWAVGPVALQQASPYEGGDSQLRVFPGVAYLGEKFIFYGPQAAYFFKGTRRSDFNLSVTVALGPNQLDVDNDPRLLGIENRNSGLLAGVRMNSKLLEGKASLALQTDVTGQSGGTRAIAAWEKSLFQSNPAKWNFTAGIQLEWNSQDYVDFYFGVSNEEALASRFDAYEAGSTIMPSVTLGGYYNISKKWQVIYNAQYQLLSSDIKDSPIVDQSAVLTGVIGLFYLF